MHIIITINKVENKDFIPVECDAHYTFVKHPIL